MTEILTTLATSTGLGVGAGVNAYATFLVFGLLSRYFPGLFHGEMATFFASTPVLIVLGILYAIEFVADKVPAVDHVWDVIHTFIRPLAGGVVAVAAANPDAPRSLLVSAAVLSGGAALGSHLTKASLRAASTTTTGGLANPLLSLIEDVFAIGSAILAIFLPVLFLVLLAVLIVPVVIMVRRFLRRSDPTPAVP